MSTSASSSGGSGPVLLLSLLSCCSCALSLGGGAGLYFFTDILKEGDEEQIPEPLPAAPTPAPVVAPEPPAKSYNELLQESIQLLPGIPVYSAGSINAMGLGNWSHLARMQDKDAHIIWYKKNHDGGRMIGMEGKEVTFWAVIPNNSSEVIRGSFELAVDDWANVTMLTLGMVPVAEVHGMKHGHHGREIVIPPRGGILTVRCGNKKGEAYLTMSIRNGRGDIIARSDSAWRYSFGS